MPSDRDRIHLFLDDECSAEEAKRLRIRIARDSNFQKEFGSACRLHFAALQADNPSAADAFRRRLSAFLEIGASTQSVGVSLGIPGLAALAASMVMVLSLAFWQFGVDRSIPEPVFEPAPLTSIHEVKQENPSIPLSVALQVTNLSASDVRFSDPAVLLSPTAEAATARLIVQEQTASFFQEIQFLSGSLGEVPEIVSWEAPLRELPTGVAAGAAFAPTPVSLTE